jgi:hypothetical protein
VLDPLHVAATPAAVGIHLSLGPSSQRSSRRTLFQKITSSPVAAASPDPSSSYRRGTSMGGPYRRDMHPKLAGLIPITSEAALEGVSLLPEGWHRYIPCPRRRRNSLRGIRAT